MYISYLYFHLGLGTFGLISVVQLLSFRASTFITSKQQRSSHPNRYVHGAPLLLYLDSTHDREFRSLLERKKSVLN